MDKYIEVCAYLNVLGEGELVGTVEELVERVHHGEVVALGQSLVSGPVGQGGVPAGLLSSVGLHW